MITALVALVGTAVEPSPDGFWDRMDGNWGDGMMGWGDSGSGWAWLMMAFVAVALIAIVVLAVTGRFSGHDGGTTPPGAARSPREVLDHRLASGEITVKEHRALAAELDGGKK